MINNIIEKLKNGEDYEARKYLSEKVYGIIDKSNAGEISLAGFLEELKLIVIEGRSFIDTSQFNK
jgi:hypothetical protein